MDQSAEDLEIIRHLIAEARLLEDEHPGASMNAARSAVEGILRYALKASTMEDGENPNLEGMKFEELKGALLKKERDDRIRKLIGIVQDSGNFASHPPTRMKSLPQKRDAHACLTTLESLAVWCSETYGKGEPNALWSTEADTLSEIPTTRYHNPNDPLPTHREFPLADPLTRSKFTGTHCPTDENGARRPPLRTRASLWLLCASTVLISLSALGVWMFGRKAPSSAVSETPVPLVRVAGVGQSSVSNPKDPDARRIAVLYFDNNSSNRTLDPLRTGLTDMLISDLDGARAVRVIERERLNAVLKELNLQASVAVDPASSQRLGRILGVEFLLMGSYFELVGQLRVDARLVRVETGEIVRSEGVTGASQDLFALERQLALKIIQGLGARLDEGERDRLKQGGSANLPHLLAYARALDLYDRGDRRAAVSALEEVVRQAPAFPQAERSLAHMRSRL